MIKKKKKNFVKLCKKNTKLKKKKLSILVYKFFRKKEFQRNFNIL